MHNHHDDRDSTGIALVVMALVAVAIIAAVWFGFANDNSRDENPRDIHIEQEQRDIPAPQVTES